MDKVDFSLGERRQKKILDESAEMGPMYGGNLLFYKEGSSFQYKLIIDSPDPEELTVSLFVDDPRLIGSVSADTSLFEEGALVLLIETHQRISQDILHVYPSINSFSCDILFNAVDSTKEDNVTFHCEWFVDTLYFDDDEQG